MACDRSAATGCRVRGVRRPRSGDRGAWPGGGGASRLGRGAGRLGRNCGNFSMPPSTDDLAGRQPPRRERREAGRGRKRGKQPAAPGAAMSWAQPDEVVDHRPAGACEGCGADLAAAADLCGQVGAAAARAAL